MNIREILSVAKEHGAEAVKDAFAELCQENHKISGLLMGADTVGDGVLQGSIPNSV